MEHSLCLPARQWCQNRVKSDYINRSERKNTDNIMSEVSVDMIICIEIEERELWPDQTCRGHALALLLLLVRWRVIKGGLPGAVTRGKGEGHGPVSRILNCVAAVHCVHNPHYTAGR